ncbi:hypothetical protein V0288_22425 [Pannus brasiliensis CCIBt3594]|uniref:Uncharacterized protein n=1 Tax=Pannus brasiliensis CCIBt3594 TaxID=1427578 RepID=A0AAW9QWV4_9CHRO
MQSRGKPRDKVERKRNTIGLTPEAWVILERDSQRVGVSGAEYIETLVRRGEKSLYDDIADGLIRQHCLNKQRLHELKLISSRIESDNQLIRELLAKLGVSPNRMPE